MQREDGGAVYLRLSTRPIEQPKRNMNEILKNQILKVRSN